MREAETTQQLGRRNTYTPRDAAPVPGSVTAQLNSSERVGAVPCGLKTRSLEDWIKYEQSKHRLCKCGCGKEIIIKPHHRYYGIPEYINGHNSKGKTISAEVRAKISKTLKGRKKTHKWCKKHSESLKIGYREGRIKSQKGIKKMSPEAREKIRKANIGANNPMFDKHRSERPSEHYHNGGYYYSSKNKKLLYYRSRYELMAYKRLEQMQEVSSYEVEPFSIRYIGQEGYERTYTPDILVHYSDGHKEVIEVKPARVLELWDNPAKFKALSEYVDKQDDMSFRIWTEKEIGIKC